MPNENTIKSLLDITSRIDERVKTLIDHVLVIDDYIKDSTQKIYDNDKRTALIEKTCMEHVDKHNEEIEDLKEKVNNLEYITGSASKLWTKVTESSVAVGVGVVIALIISWLGK